MAEILQKRTTLPSGWFSDHYHGHYTFTDTHRRYISSITSTSTHHIGSLQHPCHPHVANVIATNIKHSYGNFFFHIFSIWINRVKSARGLSRAVIINLPSICINTPMTTIYHGDYHGDLFSLNTTLPTKFAKTRLRRPQPVWPPAQPLCWDWINHRGNHRDKRWSSGYLYRLKAG